MKKMNEQEVMQYAGNIIEELEELSIQAWN